MKTTVRQTIKKIREYDKKRDVLARHNRLKEFADTYSSKYDIENLNTGKYWNNIFENSGNLSAQSPMTKDKIVIIANEIPYKNISILDLGMGDGFVEEILRERNTKYKLFGIDISKVSIDKANKNLKGEFILGDVLKINRYYNRKTFDSILAIELLEHISVSKLFSFYKNIHRLLKDDGKFIFSIPINENLHLMNTNPSAHIRDYSFPIIKTELNLNGFEIEKVKYLFAFNKYYFLKKMLSRVLRSRWKPNSLIIVAKKVTK